MLLLFDFQIFFGLRSIPGFVQGSLLTWLGKTYAVPGIEPGSAASEASALTTVLSLQLKNSKYFFLFVFGSHLVASGIILGGV